MTEGAGRGWRPALALIVWNAFLPNGGPYLNFSGKSYVLYPNREINSPPWWCYYLLYKGNRTVSATGGFHLPDISAEAHRLESGSSAKDRLRVEERSRLRMDGCCCFRDQAPPCEPCSGSRCGSDHSQAEPGHCSGCPGCSQFRSNFREATPDSKPSGIKLITQDWNKVIYFGILFS